MHNENFNYCEILQNEFYKNYEFEHNCKLVTPKVSKIVSNLDMQFKLYIYNKWKIHTFDFSNKYKRYNILIKQNVLILNIYL